ncbi:DNA-binding response regulator [Hymenobacter sp. B1770]|uniref:response regulator transcription factor n=1 Tax=Hymenobacter sp. B1770 TaxID=1718788 RepID=UPI003CE89482
MTTSTPTVLVAAAPTLYREGLVALLHEQWPHQRLSLTADVTQVAYLVCSQPYGLLILDDLLPGLQLVPLLTQLHRASPRQRVLLLTSPETCTSAAPLPWSDTRLLVSRQALAEALVSALESWLSDQPAPALAKSSWRGTGGLGNGFSPRELQVLSLVVADYCNAEIADKLCLSVRTVESHRRMLLQKAGTKTLVGLAARAVREGWVA